VQDGESEVTETQVFTDIIVPAFAVVGVAQYWLIALYRKIIKRQKLEVIRAGVVEATFSGTGPTVSLLGTIVSFNRDSIISKIDLVLTNRENAWSRKFKWFAFRPTNINLMDRGQSIPSLPFGFVVSKEAPHFYNISFSDFDATTKMNKCLSALQDLWIKLVDQRVLDGNRIEAFRQRPNSRMSFYESVEAREIMQPFIKHPEYIKLYSEIDELFCWREGSYEIGLEINTLKPSHCYNSKYTFSINESQSKELRLNVVHLANNIPQTQLVLPPIEYHISFAEYDES
jgi:hypothetical protein